MLFRQVVIVFLLFGACSKKSIENKKVLSDSKVEQVENEVSSQKKINLEKLNLSQAESLLFFEKAFESENGQRALYEASRVYLDAFQKGQLVSLEKFKTKVNLCLDQNNCIWVKRVLSLDPGFYKVLLSFYETETRPSNKLKYLDLALDISGTKPESELTEVVILSFLEHLKTQNQITEKRVLVLERLWNLVNWKKDKHFSEKVFSLIFFDLKGNLRLEKLRKKALSVLPGCLLNSDVLKKKFDHLYRQRFAKEFGFKISKAKSFMPSELKIQGNFDLLSSLEKVFVLMLWSGELSLEDSLEFFTYVDFSKSFAFIKKAVLFEVAYLGRTSTESLAKKINEQEIKNEEFVKSVLSYSASLRFGWQRLHVEKAQRLYGFFLQWNAYKSFSNKFEIESFFDSLDGLIFKTAVYPNMFAFMHFMVHSEWSSIFKIHNFEIKLDTQNIYEKIFSGSETQPWFYFTKQLPNLNLSLDFSTRFLTRSEVMEALDYFMQFEVYKIYGIDLDSYLATMSDTLTKSRLDQLNVMSQFQKNLYLSDSSEKINNFVRWCQGIEKDQPMQESLGILDLNKGLVPVLSDLQGLNVFLDKTLTEEKTRSVQLERVLRMVRYELKPILHTIDQASYLAKKHRPYANYNAFQKVQKRANEIYKLFWSTQSQIFNKLQSCFPLALKETRRRMLLILDYERVYYKKVVQPLLQSLKQGRHSLSEANDLLKKPFAHHFLFVDEFKKDSGEFFYQPHKITFLFRMQTYLSKGLVFIDGFEDTTKKIVKPPIVGARFQVHVSENLLNRKKKMSAVWGSPKERSFVVTSGTSLTNMLWPAYQLFDSKKRRNRGDLYNHLNNQVHFMVMLALETPEKYGFLKFTQDLNEIFEAKMPSPKELGLLETFKMNSFMPEPMENAITRELRLSEYVKDYTNSGVLSGLYDVSYKKMLEGLGESRNPFGSVADMEDETVDDSQEHYWGVDWGQAKQSFLAYTQRPHFPYLQDKKLKSQEVGFLKRFLRPKLVFMRAMSGVYSMQEFQVLRGASKSFYQHELDRPAEEIPSLSPFLKHEQHRVEKFLKQELGDFLEI